jgi:1-acyl-sn-glycerol-3-phosphate acyltransferase
VTDAEIIQLGSRGRPGRGSRTTPSAAARGLASARGATATQHSQPEERPPAAKRSEPRQPRPAAKRPRPPQSAATADAPAFDPPPFDQPRPDGGPEPSGDSDSFRGAAVADLAAMLGAVVAETLAALGGSTSARLRDVATDPLRTALTAAASLGVEWPASVEEMVEFTRSRLAGDYAVDEFGFDPELTTTVVLPLLRPLVHSWFRVEVRGVENIPEFGPALLVCNHAGTLPLDGLVLHAVVHEETSRHVRMLGADLLFSTPYVHDIARKTGSTLACQEDAERLLATDQLVAVFPEGFKGLGKRHADRYKLQRFGRGGFVSAAVRAQVPIVPVSIVGSEEIYPIISGAPAMARALGLPYFPVTPLFPWLGLLGLVPLPSKWVIQFGDAITTDELPPGAADDPMVVFNVTDQVRETIQHTLYALLMQRRSAFF